MKAVSIKKKRKNKKIKEESGEEFWPSSVVFQAKFFCCFARFSTLERGKCVCVSRLCWRDDRVDGWLELKNRGKGGN